MRWHVLITAPVIATAAFLSGCATTRNIDSAVATQSTLRSAPVAGYRFERLPSQQSGPAATHQAALETMAERALTAVGMKRDERRPGYSVSVAASSLQQAPGWYDPMYPRIGMSIGVGAYRRWGGIGMGIPISVPIGGYPASYRYHREVSLVMRDLSTSQVVYETRAVHDGPWSDDANILPIMFQAAVSGFPTPPTEHRVVKIDLPPATPAAPAATPSTPGAAGSAPTPSATPAPAGASSAPKP